MSLKLHFHPLSSFCHKVQIARYATGTPFEPRIVDLFGDNRISSSLATIQFKPSGAGTQLIFTEQGAFLDGLDSAGPREGGWKELLDALGRALKS